MTNNLYIPCANPELIQQLQRHAFSPYQKKALGFEQCIQQSRNTFSSYYGHNFIKNRLMSIGFSDDGEKNINAIKQIIQETLIEKYPQVIFYLYHTKDPTHIKKTILHYIFDSRPLF